MAEGEAKLKITLQDLATKGLSNLKGLLSGFLAPIASIAAAFASLKIFVIDSVKAFAEQEAAISKLNIAMKNQGIFTQELSKHYVDFAGKMQQTTRFADEQVIENMALLTSFGLLGNQMTAATKAATDLSIGLRIDLRTASMLVGKAFEGHTETLSRYGIEVDDAIPAGQKFDAVLKAISKSFGGAAQADALTFAGRIEQMRNKFNDLQEEIGQRLLPVGNKFLEWISQALDKVGLFIKQRDKVLQSLKNEQDTLAGTAAMYQRHAEGIPERVAAELAEITQKIAIREQELEAIQKVENEKIAKQLETKGKSLAMAQDESKKHKDILDQRKKDFQSTLEFISTLQQAKTKELQIVGKIAGISMATIDTFVAANKALASVPPPFNFVLMAAVITAGLANVARISGVPLAHGGMVLPSHGGTIATIAEAGRPEAVIPLDDRRTTEKLRETLGGETVININAGVIVADDISVERFAKLIDEKLFELRRNGETVAFY